MKPVMLITGAANGIANHFARAARERYRLTVTDVQFDALRESFGEETAELLPLRLNVTSADDWQSAIAATVQKYGRLDYLLNCAGVLQPRFILDSGPAEADRHLDINAKGVIYGTTFAAQAMDRQGSGHIINMASLAGIAPVAGMAYYTASKFAVRGFSIAAAFELKPRGIAVTVICPDVVKTAMYQAELAHPAESAVALSGARDPLSVEDIGLLIFRAIERRPLEMMIPPSRGRLAKFAGAFPALAQVLAGTMAKRGLKNIAALKNREVKTEG
jgi:3-oxoacyl-[acyl-carrier protein] reductase